MNKQKKNLIIILIVLILVITAINCVNAATYTFNNSTDSSSISKMISGDLPMKNGKYLKDGDVIKFKAGNYYHLKLFVNKKITLTTTKKDKGKVKFIGNVDENAINIKANKVKIYGLKFKKYNYVIIAKTTKSVFSKNTFYNNMQGVKIKGKKNKFIYNKITFSTLDINGKYNIISQNKLFKKSTISVHGYKNIIQKNSIKKTSGIHLYGKKNSVIHNKIYNGDFGISVAESKYCKISNNKLYNMYCGITIESSSKNTFNKNTLIKCKYGVMYEDNTNKFSNNIFKNCEKNFLK